MHQLRHPAVFTFALVLLTLLALAGLAPDASANGGNRSFRNNVLDPVTLGPDGTAYVGTENGLQP